MKTTWKTLIATACMAAVLVMTVALLNGFAETAGGRWALGTFAVFIFVGIAGFFAGSTSMMKHSWSKYGLYILAAGVFVATLVNAFIDSQGWFLASSTLGLLLWFEYMSTTYLADRQAPAGPAGTTPRALS